MEATHALKTVRINIVNDTMVETSEGITEVHTWWQNVPLLSGFFF